MDVVLKPGIWCMRQLRFGGKLVLLALLAVVPVLAALVEVMGTGSPTAGMERLAFICGLAFLLLVYFLAALYSTVAQDLAQLKRGADQIVAGDLRATLQRRGDDELGDLTQALAQMGRTVSAMVANVRSNAAFVSHSGQSMASGNRDLAGRTEQQTASLAQADASVAQLVGTVQENADTASRANAQAAQVRDVADGGLATMTQAVASVEAIQAGARRMDEIVGVIDGLAFQTNILALNAAVEAARAGESGRGFAVVASEVRTLAGRSAESAKEIRQLISTSSSQVAASVQQIRAAGDNLEKIVSGIHDVAMKMSQISTSCAEQSVGLNEVSSSVRELGDITRQNTDMVQRSVSHAESLEARAGTLVDSVSLFKLQQGSAEEAQALVARAASFRRQTARESFLRELTDPKRGFHDRDMYVFVLDSHGTYLAFAGNPAKVGSRVQDIAGIDGEGLLRSIVNQAEHEPGWVEYDITNPSTGKVQTKMSYVQELDGNYMGCGVYKNLVA